MQNHEKVQNCGKAVRTFLERHSHFFKTYPGGPRIGIILGTGLGGVAAQLDNPVSMPYTDIPDYPLSTVTSHSGRFSFGGIAGVPVALQEGRCHLYEGYSPFEVALGARIMSCLGAGTLVVTNAAGALNPLFNAGEIMLIDDHINHTGQSPLTGMGDEDGRSRFTDMCRVYDRELCDLTEQTALELGMPLRKGVYLGLAGPQMETPAETRMYRQWGADAVGMSTVIEVIAARHLDMKVIGLSALSNKNLPDCMEKAGIDDVIRVSSQASVHLQKLILEILKKISAKKH